MTKNYRTKKQPFQNEYERRMVSVRRGKIRETLMDTKNESEDSATLLPKEA
jgi:hypothetical protein